MKRFMIALLVLSVVSFAAGPAMAKKGHGGGHHGSHHSSRSHHGSHNGHHGHRSHYRHSNHFRTHTNYYRTRGYGYYPQPHCYNNYPSYGHGVGYRNNGMSLWFGF